jgi:hypothetical protein
MGQLLTHLIFFCSFFEKAQKKTWQIETSYVFRIVLFARPNGFLVPLLGLVPTNAIMLPCRAVVFSLPTCLKQMTY